MAQRSVQASASSLVAHLSGATGAPIGPLWDGLGPELLLRSQGALATDRQLWVPPTVQLTAEIIGWDYLHKVVALGARSGLSAKSGPRSGPGGPDGAPGREQGCSEARCTGRET